MIASMTAVVVASVVAQVGVDSLVKSHEEGLARIKTLRCTIDDRMSVDGGKTWRTMSTWTVRRSGDRQRTHRVLSWTLAPGPDARAMNEVRPPSHTDALLAPDGIRTMLGFDPAHPPREPVTVADEQASPRVKIGGMIRPAAPHGPGGYTGLPAGAFGVDLLLFFLPDAFYSTRDLVGATKGVTPLGRRDGAGDPLWDLPLKTPDGKSLITLTMSPTRGYMIVENQGTNIASGLVATRRVVDWHEPSPGIFVPKTIRVERPKLGHLRHEFLVRDVEVNAPIPDADLALRFPKGIGVADPEKNVYYLWGDGAPVRTFTTDEYNKWRREQMELQRFQ